MKISTNSRTAAAQGRAIAVMLALLAGVLLSSSPSAFGTTISPAAPKLDTQPAPKFYRNQDYIESLQHPAVFDISNVSDVFQFVLNSLPKRVRVYPTESYYYFHFYYNGIEYKGNIRLDNQLRDEGKLYFNFFKATTDWLFDNDDNQAILGASDGVLVTKLKDLVYRVRSKNTEVVFELNDLSNVVPPSDAIAGDERYIGPVFDESGIRFFLLFSQINKSFLFVLDETAPVLDELVPSSVADHVTIGRRTGFAFYRDQSLGRKILIGVHTRNVSVNNYMDGPFDQLPDSFLKGDELRQAILVIQPDLKGKIDRYGNQSDGESRYLIEAYAQYEDEEELVPLSKCATTKPLPVVKSCLSLLSDED